MSIPVDETHVRERGNLQPEVRKKSSKLNLNILKGNTDQHKFSRYFQKIAMLVSKIYY